MATKVFSERNLKFLLYEVFDVASLTKSDYYGDHNKKTFDMVLKAASQLSKKLLLPYFTEMDKNPPELFQGEVKVHPCVKTVLKEFAKGGWITISKEYKHGGEQLPLMIADSCNFIFSASNYSAVVYPGLCTGVSHLIESYGTEELNKTYLPKMHKGIWQGTMALTEAQAGSSLADIETTATPSDQGYYKIKGQKIFISAGDHNQAENIIHLMLAKIKGSPAGVKGISLFVVPKKRINKKKELISNDVVTSGIYHKLGYRGAPIAQLSIGDKDDCRGFLVGEPNKGLFYMFQMMNEARLNVGLAATAIAGAAYYAALDYTRQRKQGRKLTEKDPGKPQVPLIEHADIKHSLLFQRSIIEGSHSLLMQCCKYADFTRISAGKDKEKYEFLLDLLTPVAKSYPSEMGILSVSQALQCLGGSGYCDDYPLEQYYRDIRIHPIHEGTTAIQGMDLLGRKVTMKDGLAFVLFQDEVKATISSARAIKELQPFAARLEVSLGQLTQTTDNLISVAMTQGPDLFLADATLYLEFFGTIAIAWQWLLQAIIAQEKLNSGLSKKESDFYLGKIFTMKYFFAYELIKTGFQSERLNQYDGLTLEMKDAFFND